MISIAELSEKTKFRTDDIVKTLQAFNLIRYFGGQHSIYVSPKTLARYYTNANPNWIIDSTKIPSWWLPYSKRAGIKYGPPHFESGASCVCPSD